MATDSRRVVRGTASAAGFDELALRRVRGLGVEARSAGRCGVWSFPWPDRGVMSPVADGLGCDSATWLWRRVG
jgi:hypothetical protein